MQRSWFIVFMVASLLAVCVLVGCSDAGPTWVDDGAAYSAAEARTAIERGDTTGLQKTPTADASTRRTQALADLRGQGAEAAAAADTITRVFPAGTAAVPVYVERARVDDRPSLLLVEAWGPKDGSLSLKRLWVLDEKTGQVLDSLAR